MDATDNDGPLLLRADDIPLDVIRDIGRSVVETVGEKRSTWRRWNLMAEAATTEKCRYKFTVFNIKVVNLTVIFDIHTELFRRTIKRIHQRLAAAEEKRIGARQMQGAAQ